MATRVFLGASADWNDTNNWSSGTAPVNSDTVIIGDTSQDITTNVATGLSGITLRVGPGYTGTLGADGTELDIDGGTFDFQGNGPACYVTGTWTDVLVKGGGAMTWKGNASSNIGTMRVVGGRGTVLVQTSAVLSDIIVSGASSAIVTIESGVSTLDNVTIDSGQVGLASAVTTKLEVRGGVCNVTGSGAIGICQLEGSSVVNYDGEGTITTLTVYDGRFDGRDNPNSSITVTNCELYDGRINVSHGLDGFVFSNGVVIHGPGHLVADPGSTLTIT